MQFFYVWIFYIPTILVFLVKGPFYVLFETNPFTFNRILNCIGKDCRICRVRNLNAVCIVVINRIFMLILCVVTSLQVFQGDDVGCVAFTTCKREGACYKDQE